MKALPSLAVVLTAAVLCGAEEKESVVGRKIDNFHLRDVRGAERSLADFADRKLMVIAFLGTECPLAKLYGPRLAELAREFEPKGVAFLGINANQQDSITAIGQYVKTHGIPFPVLKDVGNVVADQLGASRTPEVFVLDARRVVRYRGRVDDQYGIGYSRPKPSRRDLAVALDELLAGKPVSTPVTRAPGCLIGRVPRATANGEVTYTRDIAPILQKRCVECHRRGQVAPFALTSYKQAAGWAEMIEEVLREGRMPPWHADPRYGRFANDCRVPEEEKQLVYRWIKNGIPEGDPRDLPPPARFVEGWRIPKPDVVITMPRPFQVPAEGDVLYQYIVVDPGFKEDKWVKAAEVRPGCRAVVHHILVWAQPPGGGTDKYGSFAANWLSGTVPGAPPEIYPEGQAKFIPAGSRLLFQIHYTPNGAPQTDQSCIGLVFADPKTVKREVSTEMAFNPDFVIPPHTANYRVEAEHVLKQDSVLLEMMPHTHLRGKTFRFEAWYADGRREILLDLPHYDFNWQKSYRLAEPKRLPKGAKIRCTATFDNSKDNPANPNPEASVRWGEQTWEEMMIGYFNIVAADEDLQKHPRPPTKLVRKDRPPLDPALKELARHALESDRAFDAFAAALHKTLPQVDRVCLTSVSAGRLKVERASYPGAVDRRLATAGFETESKAFALGYLAVRGSLLAFADLDKAPGIDLKMLSATLGSSAHVPVARDGEPGTVNFWSKQKSAFPKEIYPLLEELAEVMTGRP